MAEAADREKSEDREVSKKGKRREKNKLPADRHDDCVFEFFHGKDSVFSQFHPVKFTVDGLEYNCMEQYMHHQKAVTFKDEEMAQEIMNTDDPKLHKKLGRRVQNFDEDVWNLKSLEIVKKGNLEKFRQNPDKLEVLSNTNKKILVEACPNDTIWGIGLPSNSKKARDPSQWRGKNLLGQCLTEVRDILCEEGKNNK